MPPALYRIVVASHLKISLGNPPLFQGRDYPSGSVIFSKVKIGNPPLLKGRDYQSGSVIFYKVKKCTN